MDTKLKKSVAFFPSATWWFIKVAEIFLLFLFAFESIKKFILPYI